MATKIKTLEQQNDIILPRTVGKAVTMEDGRTLEAAMKDINSNYIKIPADVAAALGLVEGTDISTVLINQANKTNNILAAAEVL